MIGALVKDVFSKGFVSVREDDTLSSCLALLKEEMPPALVVVDGKGRYKGVIARRWIIRSRLDPSTTKVETLMQPAPTVSLDDSLLKVAKLIIESKVRQLPVYSGDKLEGFVTDENVIQGAVKEKWGNTVVEEIMTKNPFVLEENETVGAALSLFREQGISHAPVISSGKIRGMVSIHDIIIHIFQPKQRQTLGETVGRKVPVLNIPVKGIMSTPVITVFPDTTLREAVKKMVRFRISSLVVARDQRTSGILTKRDFIESIAQMELTQQRLSIQFSVKDLDVEEIQRGAIADFESFSRRYKEMLEPGILFVYMKIQGTSYKGNQLIHCRLQLRTRKGSFFSSSEGWNAGQTFRIALDRLERQILRRKEVTETYLQRIRFPQTEL